MLVNVDLRNAESFGGGASMLSPRPTKDIQDVILGVEAPALGQ